MQQNRRRTRRLALSVLVLCVCTACEGQGLSPVEPSDTGTFDAGLSQDVGLQWSPYVGVHLDGRALDAYRDALSALQRSGHLRGVRIEIRKNGQSTSDPVARAIGALGVELLGLISNDHLFEADIERQIDRIFAAYSDIRYFQIGNEVTTILPSTGPTMTIDEYMVIFRRIYDHVQARHPGRAILLTQSTFGSGLHGPLELEAMAGLGLAGLDPDKVIVAINVYDLDSIHQYRGLLSGALRRFRVWVTESGVSNPALHISFVQDRYQLLRHYLRAERVYWYVMWGGDTGPDTDFGLIKHPTMYPDYWKSPLLELLAGGRISGSR